MKLAMLLAMALVAVPVVHAFDMGTVVLYSQPVALPLSLLAGALLAVISYFVFPGVIGWIFGLLFLVPLQILFDFRAHTTEGISLWEVLIDLMLAFCYAGVIELSGGFIIGLLAGQIAGVILCLPVTLLILTMRSLL
jgi:hypothetical protein